MKHQGPAFIIAGFMCLEFATTFGDGRYWGNDGYEYGVDTGAIGLVPIELTDDICIGTGTVVTFHNSFLCKADYEVGVLDFGHLSIIVGEKGPTFDEEGPVMTVDLSKECKAEQTMHWCCNPSDLCERHKCTGGPGASNTGVSSF